MDLDSIVTILVFSYIIPQLIIAIYLLIRMGATKLPNLFWVSLFFIGNVMEVLMPFLLLPQIWTTTIIYLSNISLALYAKYTFHKREKNHVFQVIITILIALKLITFTINAFFYESYNVFDESQPLPQSEYFIYYLIKVLTGTLIAISYLYPAILSLKYYQ